MRAEIRIEPQEILGEIDPMLYGVNVEHLERAVYGGYWAELVRNRKFAGHDDDRPGRGRPVAWKREFADPPGFGIAACWEPFGAGPAVEYAHDNSVFYSGGQSQRIDLLGDDRSPRGVSQPGIAVLGGEEYNLRTVLRARGPIGPVRIGLGDDVAGLVVDDRDLADEWRTIESRLVPKAGGDFDLRITASGSGQLWVGAVSLMRADHHRAGGIRQDVAERLKTGGITLIRWPGGNFASDYDWECGVGPRDRRPTALNRAWGEWEPHDLGTDEFLTHCEQWGITPFLTVNAGSGSPEQAAAWVEYCNGPPDSEYGAIRAANGRTQPYGVRHWSIGNEIWGNFQVGHVDAESYARRCVQFARAMRAVDDRLHLTAVGHVRNVLGRWNERVSRIAGASVDAIAIHSYTLNPMVLSTEPDPEKKYLAIVAGPETVDRVLDDSISVIDEHWSGPEAEISYDEYGVREDLRTATPWKEVYTLRDGLCIAGIIQSMQQRSARVRIGAQFGFANRLGLIDVEADSIAETPCFQAFALLANHSGPLAVASTCRSESYSTPGLGTEPPQRAVPWLRVAATASRDSDRVWISVINRHPGQAVTAMIEIAGDWNPRARVSVLGGDGPNARNAAGAVPVVRLSRADCELEPGDRGFTRQFEPHSLTVLELSRV
ncbi:MAG: hypothetical protein F4Y67_04130 [Chloroflexi bacterium]|nr:hypothetical protein [Chloroflexota bacterium]MXX99990.1 hypothetical protein [Chloroflexota bacterium]MXY13063.1 hypothetical protein [Chloroflexota bacterium]